MPAKGDARAEHQSSWLSTPARSAREWRGRARNYVRFTFAGFVLIHAAIQAYRAASAGALPEPGPEAEPWLVTTVLLFVWLPFFIFAGSELSGRREVDALPSAQEQQALGRLEPVALLVVLAFTLLHLTQFAWPLLVGRFLAGDVRPALIELLSSTRSGVPLQAIAALCASGAASFYALRQLRRALPNVGLAWARGMVALAVLSYVLGSYAVIRCASGSLLR